MTAANELIRKAVKVDPTRKAAERVRPARAAGTADEPGAPVASRAGRRRPPRPRRSSSRWPMGSRMASTRRPAPRSGRSRWAWHRRSFPRMVPGEAAAIAFDARSDELVRLDARDRRVDLAAGAGRAHRRPAAGPGQPARAGDAGREVADHLARVGRAAGDREPRPAARPHAGQRRIRPAPLRAGPTGHLFILNRDPLGCAAVEYLGHPDGSIPCPPALLGRYLIIPQNDSLSDSRLAGPADRRGRIEGQAGAGGSGLGLDVADAHGRRPDRLGDRRPGGIRGVRSRRLHAARRRSARWPS